MTNNQDFYGHYWFGYLHGVQDMLDKAIACNNPDDGMPELIRIMMINIEEVKKDLAKCSNHPKQKS